MDIPYAMAHPAIYVMVRRLLSDKPRGRLLDAPAGRGALAAELTEMGFTVSCCDLYPEIFVLDDVEIKQGDLDGRLPYEDESFDLVVCIEGLEHVERPANAIREFARVLKSEGTLIVSVPNILHIEERLKWLFYGYTSHFKPVSRDLAIEMSNKTSGKDEIGLHINPIGYSEVRYLLESSGFELISVNPDAPKKSNWRFRPIIWTIRAASVFSSAKRRKQRWTNELNSEAVLAGGNTVLFEAKKI